MNGSSGVICLGVVSYLVQPDNWVLNAMPKDIKTVEVLNKQALLHAPESEGSDNKSRNGWSRRGSKFLSRNRSH